MLNKLNDAEKRYVLIEEELADPTVFSNQEKFTALMKDYKALSPVIEKYREYKKARDAHEDATAPRLPLYLTT